LQGSRDAALASLPELECADIGHFHTTSHDAVDDALADTHGTADGIASTLSEMSGMSAAESRRSWRAPGLKLRTLSRDVTGDPLDALLPDAYEPFGFSPRSDAVPDSASDPWQSTGGGRTHRVPSAVHLVDSQRVDSSHDGLPVQTSSSGSTAWQRPSSAQAALRMFAPTADAGHASLKDVKPEQGGGAHGGPSQLRPLPATQPAGAPLGRLEGSPQWDKLLASLTQLQPDAW